MTQKPVRSVPEDTLMLPSLTPQEKRHLQSVLQRAEELQRQEEWRKVKLRTASNAHLPAQRLSESAESGTCYCCGVKLVCFVNSPKACDICGGKACKDCMKTFYSGNQKLCTICYDELKYGLESGAWFYSRRKKANRVQCFATEELRKALNRQGVHFREPSRSPRSSPDPKSNTLPSIVVTDSPDRSESGTPRGILRRKFHEREFDSPDGSEDSFYLGTSTASLSASQESLVSLYSLADDSFTLPAEMASGEVQLSFEYDQRRSQLKVNVRQCKNLIPYMKTKRTSNPLVKIYLLPDKTETAKRKTSHKRNTVNPVYDETFKYHVESGDMETRSLWVTVWHHVNMGHNVFLGEVIIQLSNVHLDDPAPVWYTLHEKREIDMPSPHLIYKGDLSVSVKHVPSDEVAIVNDKTVDMKGELQVWVKEAKNLIPTHSNGYSNPFAKLLLLPDKSKKGKKKTEVIRKTLCPTWNTIIRFENVSAAELAERSLEITIWDHGRLRANEFLGGVRLNLGKGEHNGEPVKWMNASGYELTLWRAVINKPDTWVEGCLALRAHMD